MSVAPPPRRPDIEHDRDLEQRIADLEALIEEARRRATAPPSHLRRARAFRARDRRLGGLRHRRQRRKYSSGPPAAAGPSPAALGFAGQAPRWPALHGPAGGDIFARSRSTRPTRRSCTPSRGQRLQEHRRRRQLEEPAQRTVDACRGARDRARHSRASSARGGSGAFGKTTDGGRHWRMVNSGLFEGRAALRPRVASLDESAVWSLTIDAHHPSTVYATTRPSVCTERPTVASAGGSSGRSEFRRPLPEMRGPRWATNWPSRSTRTTLRPSTRARRASVVSEGLYGSSDGGTSWRRITMTDPLSFSALVFAASGALLGTDASRPGVYRSTDGGTTWSVSGMPGDKIGALTLDGGSGTIYATTDGGTLFQTTDGGDSWQTAPADLAWFGDDRDRLRATRRPTYAAHLRQRRPAGQERRPRADLAAADTGIVSTVIIRTRVRPRPPGDAATRGKPRGPRFSRAPTGGEPGSRRAAGLGGADVSTFAVAPRRPRTIFAGTQSSGLFKSR